MSEAIGARSWSHGRARLLTEICCGSLRKLAETTLPGLTLADSSQRRDDKVWKADLGHTVGPTPQSLHA